MNDDFLIKEEESNLEENELNDVLSEEERKKRRRIKHFKKYSIIYGIHLIASISLFLFGLFWQAKTDLMAVTNSLWLAFSIYLFIGWILFVYNKNILSPLIHGFKVFGNMFIGQRPKEDYYTYTERIKENQIPKYIYRSFFIIGLLLFILGFITSYIVMTR